MSDKILERRMFLDEEQGTVTVFVRLEPWTPREQPVKYMASHAREWLLMNKNIAAGEKLSGDMLRNNTLTTRFGQAKFTKCEGRFVFRLVQEESPPEPVKAKPAPVKKTVKPALVEDTPVPVKKTVTKKTTTRRRRTTKKSKGE